MKILIKRAVFFQVFKKLKALPIAFDFVNIILQETDVEKLQQRDYENLKVHTEFLILKSYSISKHGL